MEGHMVTYYPNTASIGLASFLNAMSKWPLHTVSTLDKLTNVLVNGCNIPSLLSQ